MKTQQRQEEKRQEKLDLIDQQIKEGTLVIRKMTAAERAEYPARPVTKKRTRR